MRIFKLRIEHIAFIVLMLVAGVCVIAASRGSYQATLPIPLALSVEGEYSYDGENWAQLEENSKIPARKGDFWFRGHFRNEIPADNMMAFYRNHIGVTINVNGELWALDPVSETRGMGIRMFLSMCGRDWTDFLSKGITPQDYIEIQLYNPHLVGNRSAYRDFFDTLCATPKYATVLEDNLEVYGSPFRILGSMLIITALMLLGGALSGAIVRFQASEKLMKLGFLELFAGGFIYYDTIDSFFQTELLVLNTYVRQLCMMLAAFCLLVFISDALTGKKRSVAKTALLVSGLLDGILILLAIFVPVPLFNMLPYWGASQLVICPMMIVCCTLELLGKTGEKLTLISGISLFCAILLDFAGVGRSIISEGNCSKVTFLILFAAHIAVAARSIVENYQGTMRAAKLEKELEESRIAIMLSQIQPHFLYNALGTIRGLCRENPEQAWEALGDFSRYLRGNMGALTNKKSIHFMGELRHIEAYLSLEKVRMGSRLNILYDIQYQDFFIPPLSVQPLVENAIKHGLFEKPQGGTVCLHTRREDDRVIISVSDDGVGFMPGAQPAGEEQHAHVGIINVRSRIEKMYGGRLDISSKPGEGTTATITMGLNFDGTEEMS